MKNINKRIQRGSNKLTKWIGSPQSILIHTIFFIGMFSLYFFSVPTDDILLILTTLVSLEAIYLAIFIQMTVTQNSEDLEEISEEVEEISEEVEEISEEVEDIQKDVEEISEEEEDTSKLDKIEQMLHELTREVSEIKRK